MFHIDHVNSFFVVDKLSGSVLIHLKLYPELLKAKYWEIFSLLCGLCAWEVTATLWSVHTLTCNKNIRSLPILICILKDKPLV